MSSKSPMHDNRESHSGVVPTKWSNAGRGGPKEIAEGRSLTEENAEAPKPHRTQSRESGPSGLDRVRQAAKGDQQVRFTALLHHVDLDLLRRSYYNLKREAAAGVDGVTWQAYGDGLEERLADLQGRIHRGAYHAKPSRRVWIPKTDGRQRPLGIAALEDKIVQRAVVEVLGDWNCKQKSIGNRAVSSRTARRSAAAWGGLIVILGTSHPSLSSSFSPDRMIPVSIIRSYAQRCRVNWSWKNGSSA